MTTDHIPEHRKKVPAVGAQVERSVRPLSNGAKRALMKLALVTPDNPGYAWAGRHGAVLVARGYAEPAGRDGCDGYKRFKATPDGKAEGLRLYGETANRKA